MKMSRLLTRRDPTPAERREALKRLERKPKWFRAYKRDIDFEIRLSELRAARRGR